MTTFCLHYITKNPPMNQSCCNCGGSIEERDFSNLNAVAVLHKTDDEVMENRFSHVKCLEEN